MVFKITLPEDHEAVVYLDSVMNHDYREFAKNLAHDIYLGFKGCLDDDQYKYMDNYFDPVIRHSKLARGFQSKDAKEAISHFKSNVEGQHYFIEEKNTTYVDRLKDTVSKLVTDEEYDVYEYHRYLQEGTTFNLVEIELSRKRLQFNFDDLYKEIEAYVDDMQKVQECMSVIKSIASQFEELSNQSSTDESEVEKLRNLYQQERTRITQIASRSKSDSNNNTYMLLSKLDDTHTLIKKGALSEFKTLCKEHMLSNIVSNKVTLDHDDICKQILDFSSEELTVTSELEEKISDCVTRFIKRYSETQESVTLVKSWDIHDEYSLDTYRSKPFSDWYANLPMVMGHVLTVTVRGALMMSDGELTFKYIPSNLYGSSCHPSEQVYKGTLLKDNDEFIEMCNEYGLEISDEKSMYEAAEQFKKEKGSWLLYARNDSYFPNIGKILRIKL